MNHALLEHVEHTALRRVYTSHVRPLCNIPHTYRWRSGYGSRGQSSLAIGDLRVCLDSHYLKLGAVSCVPRLLLLGVTVQLASTLRFW